MEDEQEEVKKRMRRFLKSDNAMRRPNDGRLGAFIKTLAVITIISLAGYGIYLWHPWKTIAESREGLVVGCETTGFETTRAYEVFGMRFNETRSFICSDQIIAE